MPVNKFGHTDVDNTQRVVSGVSQINNTFLRRDGANTACGDIDLDSHKLINVLNPTEAQDAATKEYVDNRASVPQSRFHYPIGTGEQTYSWVDLQEVQNDTTESQWDSLPSGLYACYTDYIPASRRGVLPLSVKGFLTCITYQNGNTVFTINIIIGSH
jgi:hypothetical protein